MAESSFIADLGTALVINNFRQTFFDFIDLTDSSGLIWMETSHGHSNFRDSTPPIIRLEIPLE